jgi:DNA repair exonuclease SbcCD ATPase subunit
LAQQLTAADAELQQLREHLAEAEDEIAALTQQLQQQERQLQAQQHDFNAFAAEQAANGEDAADEDVDGSGSRPHAPAAVVHALRAELGIANAEVARLRHQLDVASVSQQQERELTGHEILRLQQELSEAAASGSVGAAAAADAAAAEEVTSRLGTNRIGSDSSSSWHSVHDNPAFEHGGRQQQQQQDLQALLGEPCDVEEGGEGVQSEHMTTNGQYTNQAVVLPDAPAAAHAADVYGVAVSKVSRYEAKLQDQADTISSLQRQLKQQEQLLAALQKRERRVRQHHRAQTILF